MKKTKIIIAMLIVLALLLSNVVVLLNNKSIAVQSNVTVIIDSDMEQHLELSDGVQNQQGKLEGTVLTFTCEDNSTYSFRLMQGNTPLVLTRETFGPDEHGGYNDVFMIEGLESNENIYIEGTNIDLGKVRLMYDGISQGMWDEDHNNIWESQQLVNIDDVNHYQFKIEEIYQENPGQPGNPEPGEPIEDTMYNVNFGTASWVVYDETITASVNGKVINNGIVEIKGDEIITLSDNFDNRIMQVTVRVVEPEDDDPNHWFSTELEVNGDLETCIAALRAEFLPNDKTIQFEVEKKQQHGPEMPQLPEGNTDTVVTLTSDAEHAGSYANARVAINGYEAILEPPEDYHEGDPIPESFDVPVRYMYDAENDNNQVTISFSTLFIEKYVGTVTINGVPYTVSEYIDYTDRTDWLDHYGMQCVGFEIDGVAYADNYVIEVNIEPQEGKDQYIGNFLWTIDPDAVGTDEYIGHSRLELVKVVYWMNIGPDEEEVVVTAENVDQDPYIEYFPDGMVGSLVVPEGAECTMRIIPDYGYQVTSFGVNGGVIIAGDDIAEFTFPIHKGNFHLCAEVSKVEDAVDAKSEKVKSGNIEIGKNEIDAGSVVLTVNDIEPSAAKKEKFEEAAGEYKIDSYLDIDLDQVIFKGTSDDVWANRIHELRGEATITLQLEDGVDGNDIIIVHNVDDGDEYEVIEITSYDPETNTITFKTKSFSNYAIASKSTKEETYTITTGNYVLVFTDLEGHEFKAEIVDIMTLTDEQLKEFDITKEEYKKAKEKITESVKKSGTLLAVYNINVSDNNYEHNGKVQIKIKLTDEMKKYSSFKLINIDEDDFSAKDVVELKVEGDYLVGELPHLSVYALVGDTAKEANPTTGDNIVKYIIIFAIAVVGVVVIMRLNKKTTKGNKKAE